MPVTTLAEQLVETSKKWVDAKMRAVELEAEMKRLAERLAAEEDDPERDGEELRHRIRQTRELRCWSQAKLGELVGGNQAVISQIENGWRKPSRAMIEKLEKALGTSFDNAVVSGADARTLSPDELRIVNALADNNCVPLTIALLADRVGVTTARCHEMVTDLVDDGFVIKVVGGYALAVPE